jgi:hypothetical protein
VKNENESGSRYSRRETIFINFISLINLFSEGNRERLVNEIENVKNKAENTTVSASLEGMKIRNDVKHYCISPLSKITSSWRKGSRFTTR